MVNIKTLDNLFNNLLEYQNCLAIYMDKRYYISPEYLLKLLSINIPFLILGCGKYSAPGG